MGSDSIRSQRGVTLVELMVAMVVLAIATIGALGYQYHTAKHISIAKLEMTVTRTAQMVLEDWKSCGGDENYDPQTLGFGFEETNEDGVYRVVVNNLPMYIRLSYRDVAHDPDAMVTLREIGVIVRWRNDFSQLEPTEDDESMRLTTYVRLDASGG